ncbi:hypothetical protein SAMN05660236_1887 [Ohtaekwangia koreensis]|uniref:Uncharacterized protein n=1 Tax=Ohtaekwangia koreensis TaxID=688867 RepID=A0A1T5K740_9BACT|nr:hypothetical protein SAMN05660236_1887 [Ohtaekwangia koreensis]
MGYIQNIVEVFNLPDLRVILFTPLTYIEDYIAYLPCKRNMYILLLCSNYYPICSIYICSRYCSLYRHSGKGRTVSFQGADYSVQIYKKGKRAGVPERTMYFDKVYYRFQYLGDGVTKLLRANEVVATRKDDSVFVNGMFIVRPMIRNITLMILNMTLRMC